MSALLDPASPDTGAGDAAPASLALVMDGAGVLPGDPAGPLAGALAEGGLRVERLTSLAALREPVEVLLLCAALPESLIELCARARAAAPRAALLACLPGREAPSAGGEVALAERLIAVGADDLLLGVPPAGVIFIRVLSAYRARAARERQGRTVNYQRALRQIIEALSSIPRPPGAGPSDGVPVPDTRDPRLLARTFSRILAVTVSAAESQQGALLFCDEEAGALLLLSATTDVDSTQLPVLASGYEGLRGLLRGGEPALLEAPEEQRAILRALHAERGETSLLVVPVAGAGPERDARASCALVLVRPDRPAPEQDTLDFLRTAARLVGLGVLSTNVLDLLREKTRRFSMRGHTAARQREALSTYREFFESSADGVMVVDEGGRVMYLNRIGEQMTGYAAAGLAEHPITGLVPLEQREGLIDAIRQVCAQVTLMPFDLQLTTTSGEILVLSVSTSSALAEHGLCLLAFRDVTEQRIVEHELRKTKDFLTRLIDSVVDGIIAADLYGNIVLFNQGAARLTGYSPDEVIGKLPVWRLYPEGEARRIMAQLRSGDHGGTGRLSPSRRSIIAKSGEEIPVMLTAAIVYEHDREAATVGIFSDLRERLSIEERLHKVQERLAVSEKQGLIAELAGTAAHELNQPLTSVMGYAGLLKRKLPADNPELGEFIDIVVSEAERMADIVRKIGRITRYETKAYVGESRILDLDKSAGEGKR